MDMQYIGTGQGLDQNQKLLKAQTYIEAFGNDLFWREGYKDKASGKTITLDDFDVLGNNKKSQYIKIYTENQMLQLFDLLRNKKNLIDIDAEDVDYSRYVGGIRGYETTLDPLQDEKLFLHPQGLTELKSILGDSPFSYFAELFVSCDYRGKRVSSMLLDGYIQEAKTQGLPYILTRTTTNKKNPEAMFRKRGFEEIYRYQNDSLNRALFLKKI